MTLSSARALDRPASPSFVNTSPDTLCFSLVLACRVALYSSPTMRTVSLTLAALVSAAVALPLEHNVVSLLILPLFPSLPALFS